MQQQGRQQAAEGQVQSGYGQAVEWVQGASDRVKGTVNAALANLSGDENVKEKGQEVHDQGKAAQRSAEPVI